MAFKAIAPPGRLGLTKKLVLIMNLTAILLLCGSLTLSAAGFSQKVTLSAKEVKLEKVFKEIKKQTGYGFLYTFELLDKAKPVTLSVKDAELEDVLALVFDQQPLTFNILEKTVVVKAKLQAAEISNTTATPPIDIKGRITNESGEAVAGVSVVVKGTNNGTTTNTNGEFSLANVDSKAILLISSTNIETLEIAVESRTLLLLTAKTKISPLDEVQIIAYGTTTKRLNTGNVTTVKARDIEKQPVTNPLLALQGRVPGMEITQNTGLPGSGINITIKNGNFPLYVVDGVTYSSQLLPNLGNILGLSGAGMNGYGNTPGNPLSYINPSDIESIDILKDAEATAIYGSRGANGVVLITTKKGKAGRTNVDINLSSGFGKITRKRDLLDLKQYLQMRKEGLSNFNQTPRSSDYDINGVWDTTRYTNWQDVLIGGTANYTNAVAAASGGNENTQFRIATTYNKQTTVFPGDFADKRGSVSFSISNTSPNKKFSISLSGNYLVDNNGLLNEDLTKFITLPPDAPNFYNSDGTLNWALNQDRVSTWFSGNHPLAVSLREFEDKTQNLVTSANLGYQLLPGLIVRSGFGFTRLQQSQITTLPLESFQPFDRQFIKRTAQYADNFTSTWQIEPQLDYHKSFGKNTIQFLLGSTILQTISNGLIQEGTDYNSDLVLRDIKSAASVNVYSSVNSIYKYNAGFGRITYDYDNKYLVTLSGRRDGSSRFGPENQFHNFTAISGGWIFLKENWMANHLPALSFGKIRASYGTTGSDGVGNYRFMDLYQAGEIYQDTRGLVIGNLFNPDLAWEETRKLESGLELGFLRDRISLSISYYKNRSANQLTAYALPSVSGFGSIDANQDAVVENKGWEFQLNTVNINSSNFRWSSSFNITINRNRLVAMNPENYSIDKRSIGHPLGTLFVYKFAGVDPQTGVYQFYDEDKNVIADPSAIVGFIPIDLTPKYYGGFQNSFSYKGLELDFIFQFTKQLGRNTLLGLYPGGRQNQPISVLDRWQKLGDISTVQKYDSRSNIFQAYDNASRSDVVWSDASFIRLKNLALSYQLPIALKRAMKMQNCKLYVQGQNLLTITNFRGAYPENQGNQSVASLPPLKMITLGLQLTF